MNYINEKSFTIYKKPIFKLLYSLYGKRKKTYIHTYTYIHPKNCLSHCITHLSTESLFKQIKKFSSLSRLQSFLFYKEAKYIKSLIFQIRSYNHWLTPRVKSYYITLWGVIVVEKRLCYLLKNTVLKIFLRRRLKVDFYLSSNFSELFIFIVFFTFSSEKVLDLCKMGPPRFCQMSTFWDPLNPKKWFSRMCLSVCL